MRTIIRGSLVHACPYQDEVDRGTIVLTFDGPAPELHSLADRLASFEHQKITHEDLTALIARETGATVVTSWITAGLAVEVRC